MIQNPGSGKPLQEKTISIIQNGTYTVLPDNGKALSKAQVTVEVAGAAEARPELVYSTSTEIAGSKQLTSSISAIVGELVVAAVVCRSPFTAPAGWTVLLDGLVAAVDQRLILLYKFATSTTETFVATQRDANRIYLNLHSFYNAGTPTLYIPGRVETTMTFTLTKTHPSHVVLWAAHEAYWSTSSALWGISNKTPQFIPQYLGTSSASRLMTIFDITNYFLSHQITIGSTSADQVGIAALRIPGKSTEDPDTLVEQE